MDEGEMTSNFSFAQDLLARRVMRSLLILEILATTVVVSLSILHLFPVALTISVVMLLLLVAALLWLHARYQELPVTRERQMLERLSLKFQKRMQMEQQNIQAAIRWRAQLFQAEKEENQATLKALQAKHVQNGLRNAFIKEAVIRGVDPKLKEQLAAIQILSAEDLSERIWQVPGLKAAEGQALMDWRNSLIANLESSKPDSLPERESEAIQKKYRSLQDDTNAAHRKAILSKQMLEYELISFRERLQQLNVFTFPRYLGRSLASRNGIAAPLALVLILTQVVSSVSAAASLALSLMVPITALTTSPTSIFPPTVIVTQTLTPSSAATLPPAETSIAGQVPTQDSLPTATLVPESSPLPPASLPVSGTGNCDPSYPDVCIAPPPPDLDCKDIPYRRFQVLPPDPHSFDRDGDGIGCES